jgi:hypothetical protein
VNSFKVGNEPLVLLDTSELLGFGQFAKVASTDSPQSLHELCRLLSKRGEVAAPKRSK